MSDRAQLRREAQSRYRRSDKGRAKQREYRKANRARVTSWWVKWWRKREGWFDNDDEFLPPLEGA